MQKLNIAILSTPWESVPPKKYGGTELVVHNLTEELVRRGHQVTLFATGDSQTAAKLVSITTKGLYRLGVPWTDKFYTLLHTTALFDQSEKFDIIHNHFAWFGLFFSGTTKTPVITTYHGDLTELKNDAGKFQALKKYCHQPFVSISRAQAKNSPIKLNIIKNVYNGIEIEKFDFSLNPGKYLVWIGRVTEKKGTCEAIEIAKTAGLPLILAGKIDYVDQDYWEQKIKPQIDGRRIKFIGEVAHKIKVKLLKNALALINPIKWNEPFGLTMAEAMVCGTPVIAFNYGSASEVVKHDKTGFVVKTIPQAVAAMKKIKQIDRRTCRKWVEKKFSAKKMVDGYEEVYYKILSLKS